MVADSAEHYAVSRPPMASTRVLRELAAAVERAGVSRERFLAAAKLTQEQLDDAETRIPVSEVIASAEAAIEVTADPALGLHWGEWLSGRSFSVVTHLLAHASTLRQAFDMLFKFSGLLTDRLNVELVERDDVVELHAGDVPVSAPRARRFCAELATLGFFRMLRDFGAADQIRSVDFVHPAPHYRSEYTRVFDGLERFERPFNGILFARAFMDVPSPHKDEDLQDTLRSVAERQMSRLREGPAYAVRVQELLVQQRAPYRVDMRTVAGWLKISERSLNRRLADERRSYRAIADEAAATVAKRLLTQERRSIQETAFSMGFSEASAFHRAFKRWTGTTPTAFRKRSS